MCIRKTCLHLAVGQFWCTSISDVTVIVQTFNVAIFDGFPAIFQKFEVVWDCNLYGWILLIIS